MVSLARGDTPGWLRVQDRSERAKVKTKEMRRFVSNDKNIKVNNLLEKGEYIITQV